MNPQGLAHLDVRVRGSQLPPPAAVRQLIAPLDALRSVALVFTGNPGPTTVADVVALQQACADRGAAFAVEFVLESDADATAALGHTPTSLGPILELSRSLRERGLIVRWWVPILDALAYRLEGLFSLAADEGVDAVLVPAHIVHAALETSLDDESARFVADFVRYRLLDEDRGRFPAARADFYEKLLPALALRDLKAVREGESIAVLEQDATGAWTVRGEERLPLRPLVSAIDESPRRGTRPASPAGGRADVIEVLSEGVRALAQWSRTALIGRGRARRERDHPTRMRRVLVIGAYGGDHIGDTAIFGGVLLRIHKRHHTTEAILVSQRPEHTRRLAAMLDVPVHVTVEEYRQSTVGALLDRVDGVVFAGGPLMDLPKQLVKHLYAVARARRKGKPFVIEGIGAGPFIRRVSASTARLLVLMAEHITVRTADDARAPLLRGLDPVVGRDPAFDYLETRGPLLTRLPQADRQWLDRLFRETEGRLTVGINLRPIRPDYTVGAPPAQRAEYTRQIESRFEAQLAAAMRQFHDVSGARPCFIFYPMNAIQFGSSDLRSAYRLKRLLGETVDFRIWEGDPSIDGIVALLRRVDVAITMRFHATIYALSQGTRAIGIDYRPGKKDKVAALLDDAGQARNCCRIDEMTTDWMFERLMGLTGSARTVRPDLTAAGIGGTTLRPVRPPASM